MPGSAGIYGASTSKLRPKGALGRTLHPFQPHLTKPAGKSRAQYGRGRFHSTPSSEEADSELSSQIKTWLVRLTRNANVKGSLDSWFCTLIKHRIEKPGRYHGAEMQDSGLQGLVCLNKQGVDFCDTLEARAPTAPLELRPVVWQPPRKNSPIARLSRLVVEPGVAGDVKIRTTFVFSLTGASMRKPTAVPQESSMMHVRSEIDPKSPGLNWLCLVHTPHDRALTTTRAAIPRPHQQPRF